MEIACIKLHIYEKKLLVNDPEHIQRSCDYDSLVFKASSSQSCEEFQFTFADDSKDYEGHQRPDFSSSESLHACNEDGDACKHCEKSFDDEKDFWVP